LQKVNRSESSAFNKITHIHNAAVPQNGG